MLWGVSRQRRDYMRSWRGTHFPRSTSGRAGCSDLMICGCDMARRAVAAGEGRQAGAGAGKGKWDDGAAGRETPICAGKDVCTKERRALHQLQDPGFVCKAEAGLGCSCAGRVEMWRNACLGKEKCGCVLEARRATPSSSAPRACARDHVLGAVGGAAAEQARAGMVPEG